ncbi:MAG: eight-cysteine-cluster domain-containing protein [Candidatus Woesearchaeota archaeon]
MKKHYFIIFVLLIFFISCNEKEVVNRILPDEFCGISTYESCETDKDCIRSGCNGEYCKSARTPQTVTVCLWKDCYNNSRYECKCVSNQCQWVKTS